MFKIQQFSNYSSSAVIADKIQYEFVDGVRDLLLDGVPLTESTEVLRKVSEYVAQRTGLSVDDFTAMLINPGLVDDSSGVLIRPFAQVTAKVLRRLGGKYAELAEEMEQSSEELSQTRVLNRSLKIGRASCREKSVDLGGRRIIKKKKN